MRLELSGVISYIDKYGRAILCLSDESAAKVAQVTRDATPDTFPVKCKIPPHEYVGRRVIITVIARRYSFVSTAAHNAGQVVEGTAFRMERARPQF